MSKLKHYINKLAHYLIGFFAGIISYIDFRQSVFLYILFFCYEYVEETKIQDEMYIELKEFTIGYILGLLLVYYPVLIKLLTHNIF